MTKQEAIHLIEWLQKTPTAKQFYGFTPEELLTYYKEQNPALRIHDFVARSEHLSCDPKNSTTINGDFVCYECGACGNNEYSEVSFEEDDFEEMHGNSEAENCNCVWCL